MIHKYIPLLTLCSTLLLGCSEENEYKYGLTPIHHPESYARSVESNPDNKLVEINQVLTNAVLDIRYATSNNFTETVIYSKDAGAFARLPVVNQLKQIEDSLEAIGLGLVVYDAYRPYSATVKFYEIYGDTTYVASPYGGSRHNRGCAVDISLYSLKDSSYIQMPTEYDDFSLKAHPTTPLDDSTAMANRDLLIGIMQHNGFTVYPSEWWHYDYMGWEKFEIMDLSFNSIREQNAQL